MHEISLCESMLQIIEDQAHSQGFQRVVRVRLEIGRLASVDSEALRFGFDVVTRNTLAADAILDIVELPGRGWCLPCRRRIELTSRFDPCPFCGGHQIQITGGDQMQIKDMEVE